MDYIAVLNDSLCTSVTLKLFKTKQSAVKAHLDNSTLKEIPLKDFQHKVDNFNPQRLQSTAAKAYPLHDRPRGIDDLNSVKFYQKQIKKNIDITPIWLIKIDNKMMLLDGAHRVVASYIENKEKILAYVIEFFF